jgi:CDP-paratose 2-epimerase
MALRVLVTGGAGFVGSHLALGLAKTGAEVVALDNLRRRGSELNLPRVKQGGVNFAHGDIRVEGDLDRAGPFDVLIECSAEPSVMAGYGESPRYAIDTNLLGAVNCLEAARKYGAAVVFLSTSRVYPLRLLNGLRYREGETRFVLEEKQDAPGVSAKGISEQFPLDGLRSLYGATKLAAELLLQEYVAMYGVRGVINRCGILTGPWQMGKIDQGVVVLWAARHIFGGPLSYIGYGGKGKQVRDVLHVDDLFQLVLYQLEHLDKVNGEVFNVGGGLENALSLRELTDLCRKHTGQSIDIQEEAETRPADVPIYITDNTKVSRATGWQPRRNPGSIVGEICEWIEANRDTLRPVLS